MKYFKKKKNNNNVFVEQNRSEVRILTFIL